FAKSTMKELEELWHKHYSSNGSAMNDKKWTTLEIGDDAQSYDKSCLMKKEGQVFAVVETDEVVSKICTIEEELEQEQQTPIADLVYDNNEQVGDNIASPVINAVDDDDDDGNGISIDNNSGYDNSNDNVNNYINDNNNNDEDDKDNGNDTSIVFDTEMKQSAGSCSSIEEHTHLAETEITALLAHGSGGVVKKSLTSLW
ncbi:hypothetical protein RFI_03593, partial [Reticulomyxa filosa]